MFITIISVEKLLIAPLSWKYVLNFQKIRDEYTIKSPERTVIHLPKAKPWATISEFAQHPV